MNDDIKSAVRLPIGKNGSVTEADYLAQTFQMPAAFAGEQGWGVLLVDVTRLRRMDEAKTRALSTLGHEVKTPVAGMRMTLQLLLDEKLGVLTPEQRELLGPERIGQHEGRAAHWSAFLRLLYGRGLIPVGAVGDGRERSVRASFADWAPRGSRNW